MTNFLVIFSIAKNGWAKRSKKCEAKLRAKISQFLFLPRSFASLRSAIFSDIKNKHFFLFFYKKIEKYLDSVILEKCVALRPQQVEKKGR